MTKRIERLGELLVRENRIGLSQYQTAAEEQSRTGERLGAILVRKNLISEQEILDFLSKQYGVQSIDLSAYEIDPEVINLITPELALKHRVIPVSRTGASLIVATSDPTNIELETDLRFKTEMTIIVTVASEKAIDAAIERYYSKSTSFDQVLSEMQEPDHGINAVATDEAVPDINDLTKGAAEAPIIKMCDMIMYNAIKKGASDIHLEPYETAFRIRYRLDGILYEEKVLPIKFKNEITARFKILARLKIEERRRAQDGRFKITYREGGKQKEMEFRVSVLPTLFGEKVVMRLLDKSNLQLDMAKLGFTGAQLDDFMENIHKPYGMVLVTGPTGSGKTTTLYSALSDLNKISENISTAEDPVEYNIFGINQVHVNDDVEMGFANTLRAFLRQDPDIIMVGEIRDFETAEIAVKAALTGHLVLSTLHTNDAPSTVSRLLNMGVEPFLVTASVNLILAQRLARKICEVCKKPDTKLSADEKIKVLVGMGMDLETAAKVKLFKGVGCPICNGTGYKGRLALYELMVFSDALKEMVLSGSSTIELKTEAIKEGMKTLRMAGLDMIGNDLTTIAEVGRVTAADKK